MIFNRIESKKSIAICLLALVGSNFSCQPNSRFFLLLLLLLLLFRFNFLFHYSFQCLPWLTSEWLLLACLCFIELLNLSVVFHFLYRFLFWFFWFRIQFGFFFSFFFFWQIKFFFASCTNCTMIVQASSAWYGEDILEKWLIAFSMIAMGLCLR